ncbi:unnamed protein product [[Candida] boidinii]|uniref:Unnamed protein product n=1 Tax=Candida boidinii TaxID=5477 RepID=A0ACB5TWM3_CANBO|nr:unnamed protein product [[Candida] boidinii]
MELDQRYKRSIKQSGIKSTQIRTRIVDRARTRTRTRTRTRRPELEVEVESDSEQERNSARRKLSNERLKICNLRSS